MSQTVTYDKPEPLFVQLSLTDPRSAEHEALRDRIIDTCLPLAENIARRFAGRGDYVRNRWREKSLFKYRSWLYRHTKFDRWTN